MILICNLLIYFIPHYFNLSTKVFIVFTLFERIVGIQIFLLCIIRVSTTKLVEKVLFVIKHSYWNIVFTLDCKNLQIKFVCFYDSFFPFNLYFLINFIKVSNFLQAMLSLVKLKFLIFELLFNCLKLSFCCFFS